MENYPDDLSRIVRVMTLAGYPISRKNAENAWFCYSETLSAGWMMLDGVPDQHIVECVKPLWDGERDCWVFSPDRYRA